MTRHELTLLLRQTTGHMEQPRLQQQQRKPNSSQRTLTGSAFLRVTLTRVTVAWGRAIVNIIRVSELSSYTLNSSGATLECSEGGNSVSNLLDKPNLEASKNDAMRFLLDLRVFILNNLCSVELT